MSHWLAGLDKGLLVPDMAIRNLFVLPLDELRQCCLSHPGEAHLSGACRRALRSGSSSGFDGVTGSLTTYRTALALQPKPIFGLNP